MDSLGASRTVEELGLNTGITDKRQRVVFHTLRHTYGTTLALKGLEKQSMIKIDSIDSMLVQLHTHIVEAERLAAKYLSEMEQKVDAEKESPAERTGYHYEWPPLYIAKWRWEFLRRSK